MGNEVLWGEGKGTVGECREEGDEARIEHVAVVVEAVHVHVQVPHHRLARLALFLLVFNSQHRLVDQISTALFVSKRRPSQC